MPDSRSTRRHHVAVRHAPAVEEIDPLMRLLTAADGEFLPPLSARTSTVQTDLARSEPGVDGVNSYLQSLLSQRLVVAEVGGELAGFASYRPDYAVAVPEHGGIGPVHYLSTIVVNPHMRGGGVARALYGELIATAGQYGQPVATRTWSSNDAHIALLGLLGFAELARITDDRGPGIDTLYYVLPLGACAR